ncbi:MAG: hypothetical protein NC204_06280 [Candidatus Amulumruptor caecigallinarius]|nr:hypothetical protein [Candidatus Amulumruptor caecigallinarius]
MKKISLFLCWFILFSGAFLIVFGCARHIYVPVQSTVRDSLISNAVRVDTIMGRDSVYLCVRGDTVVKERFSWRVKTKLRVDTVYKSRVDTLRVTLPAPASPGTKKTGIFSSWLESASHILIIVLIFCVWRLCRKKPI